MSRLMIHLSYSFSFLVDGVTVKYCRFGLLNRAVAIIGQGDPGWSDVSFILFDVPFHVFKRLHMSSWKNPVSL